MKKLKKTFLHVGSDKTGSTAIQYTLHHHRAELRSQGYVYAPGLYHPLMAAHFSEQPLQLDYFRVRTSDFNFAKVKTEAKQFISELEHEIEFEPVSNLIISYEGFTGLTETELKDLKSFLEQYSEKIEVIYYLRPPLSYAPSAISQRIKFGSPSWNIHPPVTHYRPRLEVLEKVFGKKNINLRNFKRNFLVNGDVVVDFLSQIGIDSNLVYKQFSNTVVTNSALSEEAILIGDEIIRLLGERGPQGAEFNQIFLPTLEKIQGRKYKLSQLQRDVIHRATIKDLQYIKSEFGLDISDIDATQEASDHKNSALSRNTAHSLARLIIENALPDFQLPDVNIQEYHEESVINVAQGKIIFKETTQLTLAPSELKNLTVEVVNESAFWWGGKVAPVRASYHWFDANKNLVEFDGLRTELPVSGIKPHGKTLISMLIQAPSISGEYYLELTLVQEYFNWFESLGFQSQLLRVSIE
ncbi:MAG: hypothetical protein JJU48_10700 [Methylophaga sp.]|nr:hypothetical protein [Methylophaga sp.]